MRLPHKKLQNATKHFDDLDKKNVKVNKGEGDYDFDYDCILAFEKMISIQIRFFRAISF